MRLLPRVKAESQYEMDELEASRKAKDALARVSEARGEAEKAILECVRAKEAAKAELDAYLSRVRDAKAAAEQEVAELEAKRRAALEPLERVRIRLDERNVSLDIAESENATERDRLSACSSSLASREKAIAAKEAEISEKTSKVDENLSSTARIRSETEEKAKLLDKRSCDFCEHEKKALAELSALRSEAEKQSAKADFERKWVNEQAKSLEDERILIASERAKLKDAITLSKRYGLKKGRQ